jgi:hypothetical protein
MTGIMTEIKSMEELHTMTAPELQNYSLQVWRYMKKIDTIRSYVESFGQIAYLPAPSEVEFSEEEE